MRNKQEASVLLRFAALLEERRNDVSGPAFLALGLVVQTARQAAGEAETERRPDAWLYDVRAWVSEQLGRQAAIKATRRYTDTVPAKAITAYVLRHITRASWPKIAQIMNCASHVDPMRYAKRVDTPEWEPLKRLADGLITDWKIDERRKFGFE